MQTMSQRLFAAVAAVMSFGGLAAAQSTPPNLLPAIPQAPTQQVQVVQYQMLPQGPNMPGQIVSIPQVMPSQPVAGTQNQPVQANQVYQSQAIVPPPTAAPAAAQAGQGCVGCGKSVGTPNPYLPRNTAFGAGLAPVPYNETCAQCANGCGSYKSDFGFVFGSCKSFFNPCGPIPCGGGVGAGCQRCGKYPFGTPYGKGYNTCVYDSYLNH